MRSQLKRTFLALTAVMALGVTGCASEADLAAIAQAQATANEALEIARGSVNQATAANQAAQAAAAMVGALASSARAAEIAAHQAAAAANQAAAAAQAAAAMAERATMDLMRK